jgi:LysR substrate binding domain.
MHNNQRHVTIEVEPHFSFSSVDMCLDFALAGHGVTLLRRQEGEPHEKAGRLVKVLPEWSGGFEHDVHMVTGSTEHPRRLRLFLDHIRDFYAAL